MRYLHAVAFLVIALSAMCTSAWAYPLVSGEGVVQGTVYATGSYGEYIPLYWVTVTASNAKNNFTTSTDNNGFYSLFLPVGAYNLTAETGFRTLRANVTVSSSSVSFVDFDFTWNTHFSIPE